MKIVIATRLEELRGWEDTGPLTLRFDGTANAPSTIRLAVFGYSAFNAERYLTATSVVVRAIINESVSFIMKYPTDGMAAAVPLFDLSRRSSA